MARASDALLDAYLADVEAHRQSGKPLQLVPGVMTAEGIKPWQESAFPGVGLAPVAPDGKPRIEQLEGGFETHQVDWGVTPRARRTSAERLEAATKIVYETAMASYRATGKVSFPRSVLEDIQRKFWQAGEPVTIEQIESLTEHEIRPLCERYAAKLLTLAQRKNPGNNRHILTPEIVTK